MINQIHIEKNRKVLLLNMKLIVLENFSLGLFFVTITKIRLTISFEKG